MIFLYGVYRSRVSRNVWLCLEMGVPFEQIPVIQSYRLPDPLAADAPLNTASPSFLALNPMGLIPCLVEEDGSVLFESLAINLHLARRFGGPLAAQSAREDGLITQWTLWAATEIEGKAVDILFNLVPDASEAQRKIATSAAEGLRKPLAVLERWLTEQDWIAADRFTVADINVAEVLRYAQGDRALIAAFPAVERWLKQCQARPAFQVMWERRSAEPAWSPPARP